MAWLKPPVDQEPTIMASPATSVSRKNGVHCVPEPALVGDWLVGDADEGEADVGEADVGDADVGDVTPLSICPPIKVNSPRERNDSGGWTRWLTYTRFSPLACVMVYGTRKTRVELASQKMRTSYRPNQYNIFKKKGRRKKERERRRRR